MDAGIETSAALIQNIALALVAYPECQQKAQEEVDRVVGVARMPMLADYKDLPYVRAFVDEVRSYFTQAPTSHTQWPRNRFKGSGRSHH